nr:hypothetical protein CPGR_02292 [Mycolicibacterium malmesburyense]
MTAAGGRRFEAQHCRGSFIGGVPRRRPAGGKDLNGIAVDGCAVGTLSFDEDKADG